MYLSPKLKLYYKITTDEFILTSILNETGSTHVITPTSCLLSLLCFELQSVKRRIPHILTIISILNTVECSKCPWVFYSFR